MDSWRRVYNLGEMGEMERRAYKAGVTPRMGPGNIEDPVKTSTYSFAELVVRTSEHHSINNDTECVKVNSLTADTREQLELTSITGATSLL